MALNAHAQSSVTLYGVADVFLEYGKSGTKAAPTRGVRLESGAMNGSRIGFKGTEDLGGGLKANFLMEHGLLLDSGNQAVSSTFWNRQIFAGVSGKWGALTAGRQYSPLVVQQDAFDPALGTTLYGSAYNSGVIRSISRVNNSIVYMTPASNGFSGTLMAGLGEKVAGTRYGFLGSGSVKYLSGPLGLGFVYLQLNKADPTQENKKIWNLSGSYKFGDFQLLGGLQQTKNDVQTANVNDDRDEFVVGGVYTRGLGQIRASYGHAKVKDADSSSVSHASIGYLHNLSKRTALFGIVQAIRNPDNLAYRPNGYSYDATADGMPAGAGVNARSIGLGVRHRF